MEEPNDDIDTETLQAQIDLSMAYAQNLVASWLSGSNSLTQSSSRAAEAETELQGILRRPPRCVSFFPPLPNLARRLYPYFNLFSTLFYFIFSSPPPFFFWALGWALAHRSLKIPLLHRRVS